MSTAETTVVNARRKALSSAVCCICFESGFSSIEKAALESMTEMMQSLLTEIARSSRGFCELSGRVQPLIGDVVMALVELGIDIESIPPYAKRSNRLTLPLSPNPQKSTTTKILQAGEKRSHPSYIPEHYPQFPDPHAYIRTPTHKQPVTEYEAIREKAASQKRDVERALTRFVAKTGATQSLFPDDTTLFPLIACKPAPNSYINALLPKDQIFEEEEEKIETKTKEEQQQTNDQTSQKTDNSDIDIMDNPYLRPVKMPRKRKR